MERTSRSHVIISISIRVKFRNELQQRKNQQPQERKNYHNRYQLMLTVRRPCSMLRSNTTESTAIIIIQLNGNLQHSKLIINSMHTDKPRYTELFEPELLWPKHQSGNINNMLNQNTVSISIFLLFLWNDKQNLVFFLFESHAAGSSWAFESDTRLEFCEWI